MINLYCVCVCVSEELCSTQRELDVLSQQYSLKCLECAHLAQALEAERHALQQCQRQYQEISVRHQVNNSNRLQLSSL